MEISQTKKRFVVLKARDYLLAVSLETVIKVITCPTHLRKTLYESGLAQIGQRTLAILNPYQALNLDRGRDESFGKFLLIVKNDRDDLYGIPLGEPPNIIDIETDQIQAATELHFPSQWLSWIDKVAVLPDADASVVILIFDINRALPAGASLALA